MTADQRAKYSATLCGVLLLPAVAVGFVVGVVGYSLHLGWMWAHDFVQWIARETQP